MEQDVGNPHFSRSECNDINSYFHEPGEISFPIVESPTANQRIQYALQEGDFFSVTNPQNRELLTVSSLELAVLILAPMQKTLIKAISGTREDRRQVETW